MLKSLRGLCLILQDRCWVVHIPFVRMGKFQFLVQLLLLLLLLLQLLLIILLLLFIVVVVVVVVRLHFSPDQLLCVSHTCQLFFLCTRPLIFWFLLYFLRYLPDRQLCSLYTQPLLICFAGCTNRNTTNPRSWKDRWGRSFICWWKGVWIDR